ncbi:hypothetical protein B0H12DRAFT_1078801 [Mycena haematopus]|nr:hypothetical protein B0H12DRAFT_1078801 [Mycena haematopus]
MRRWRDTPFHIEDRNIPGKLHDRRTFGGTWVGTDAQHTWVHAPNVALDTPWPPYVPECERVGYGSAAPPTSQWGPSYGTPVTHYYGGPEARPQRSRSPHRARTPPHHPYSPPRYAQTPRRYRSPSPQHYYQGNTPSMSRTSTTSTSRGSSRQRGRSRSPCRSRSPPRYRNARGRYRYDPVGRKPTKPSTKSIAQATREEERLRKAAVKSKADAQVFTRVVFPRTLLEIVLICKS